MQIEITEIEPCKLKINYQASPEQISNKRSEIVNYFKKASVPGFRKGKASADAIKFHYKDQIEESLKRALAEDAYHNTIFEKKLKPHGQPYFSALFLGDGKFNCEFQMYTKPDFQLQDVKNLEVVKPHQSEDAVDVAEKMLEELRYRFGEMAPYKDNDFVQLRDAIIIDYISYVDGEKVDDLSGEGEMFTVGQSDMPEFDQNLLGMNLGETREFDFVVPSNGLPSLIGKTVHMKVTLNLGSKVVPMPLDDSLAIKLGKKDFNELKYFITSRAQTTTNTKLKNALNEAVCNKLVSMHAIEVPNWMALVEAQYIAQTSKLNWNTIGDEDREKLLSMAVANVKLSLILDKIRDSEPEAQLSEQESFNYIKDYIAQNHKDKPIENTLQEMNKTGQLQYLISRLKDEYALEFVIKHVKIIE